MPVKRDACPGSVHAAGDRDCEFLSANCVKSSGKPAFAPYRLIELGGEQR